MNDTEAIELLLKTRSMRPYARQDYFDKVRRDAGFSKEGFAELLTDAGEAIENEFYRQKSRTMGLITEGEISTWLNLSHFTNGKWQGHLSKQEIEQINNSVKYFSKQIKLEKLNDHVSYLKSEISKGGKPQLSQKLKKNPDTNIFKNDYAFTLFTLMHKQRPHDNNPKAFYSATYKLMKNDGFINESIQPSVFKNFVEDYDKGGVYLEKIESRHNPSEKNKGVYNEQKDKLPKQG